ncbi:MAG: sigma-70 family RNA polymerase sigma factor [Candidatus Eremiobacteraeota bacterium]|nr:sigma-70 family RNA polymerase sigma factor [Candidatus Eremiobacteraeota bacterium]
MKRSDLIDAQTREAQIRDLFPLVKKIARRVSRIVPGSDLDDLIGEGCVGLIRAVDSFDPGRGPSLEQYARRICAGAMLNGIRRLDPVSERVRRDVREGERQRYAIATERGALPTMQEMERLRPGLRRANMHAYRYSPVSLDAPLPIGEQLSGDWAADPAAIVSERADGATIRQALQKLSPRHRKLLGLHYFAELSLHRISETMAVSPQRVSQLHIAAITNLKKWVRHASAR